MLKDQNIFLRDFIFSDSNIPKNIYATRFCNACLFQKEQRRRMLIVQALPSNYLAGHDIYTQKNTTTLALSLFVKRVYIYFALERKKIQDPTIMAHAVWV